MQIKIIKNLLHTDLLRRGLALLFFILIFVDISTPNICCQELNEQSCSEQSNNEQANIDCNDKVSQSDAISDAIEDNATPSIIADDHCQQDDHSKCVDDEGCFCCCAHFITTNFISITIDLPLIEQTPESLMKIFLPVPPARNMFHPPRDI